ncbi:flagellar protein FlhE [Halomonas huangheensis]|uniref:Flagellar FlhE n=1 Tax=Halomonas huangheensis TaxID=1178482 RepID=W1N5S2_9GAMM|nr:flagellar protein FlhE [Halomonas huangheensis]ALM54287.1 hypothetical protein AR456_19945 [Halomonas huangheensis]ERL50839.1 hypothetical protein BJB45_19780 [Halomonas huangheensis]
MTLTAGCRWLLMVLLSAGALSTATPIFAAPGSWVAAAPRLTVASRQLDQSSALLTPPSGHTNGVIDSISWQYRVAPGADLEARLCLQQRCLRLDTARGSSRHFTGLPASGPLEFRFRLADDQSPVVVDAMQLIVNHR